MSTFALNRVGTVVAQIWTTAAATFGNQIYSSSIQTDTTDHIKLCTVRTTTTIKVSSMSVYHNLNK